MRLSKTDALFLYKTLYHYDAIVDNDVSLYDVDALNDFLHRVESFLTTESSASSEEEEEEEEADPQEEDYEGEETPAVEADAEVDSVPLTNLPHATVTSSDGTKTTLEFDFSNREDTVDALLDGGSILIEDVEFLKLNASSIELYADGAWHTYTFRRKSPSSWSKLLEEGTIYAVVGEE